MIALFLSMPINCTRAICYRIAWKTRRAAGAAKNCQEAALRGRVDRCGRCQSLGQVQPAVTGERTSRRASARPSARSNRPQISPVEVPRSDQSWRWHSWLGFTKQY
jgi:hypothetical protein